MHLSAVQIVETDALGGLGNATLAGDRSPLHVRRLPQFVSDWQSVLREGRSVLRAISADGRRLPAPVEAEVDADELVVISPCPPSRSLGERMTSDDPFGWGRALSTTLGVAGILADLHDRHIRHGNLSLDTVHIDPDDGAAIVADALTAQLTARYDIMRLPHAGTISHLAPELLEAGATATIASDVYALGALFVELCTGRKMFAADNSTVEEFRRRAATRLPDVRGVRAPAEIRSLILSCLEKKATNRPRSVAPLIDSLGRLRSRGDGDGAHASFV